MWARDNAIRPCCPTTQTHRKLELRTVEKQLRRGEGEEKKKVFLKLLYFSQFCKNLKIFYENYSEDLKKQL